MKTDKATVIAFLSAGLPCPEQWRPFIRRLETLDNELSTEELWRSAGDEERRFVIGLVGIPHKSLNDCWCMVSLSQLPYPPEVEAAFAAFVGERSNV